jgi:citrate synthase
MSDLLFLSKDRKWLDGSILINTINIRNDTTRELHPMRWLDVDTATQILGIKPASLYAYVSRGLVRARSSDVDPRASLYASSDIDQLLARKRTGRARDAIARGAIGWGEPVLESAITGVIGGRLVFRGFDAIDLSQTQTLEEIASLLWGCDGLPIVPQSDEAVIARESKTAGFHFLANKAARALPSVGRSADNLAGEAAVLLEGLAHAMALGAGGQGAHRKLASLWKLTDEQADTLRRALVLLADHELNPSTFSARVAASTGGSLAASALAGFTTLTGPYHGEAAIRALDFLADAQRLGTRRAVSGILERAQILPGLGHNLYPDGDPRARALLVALKPHSKLEDAIQEAEMASASHANIDMALAAMTLQFGLPATAPFTLFATARMAGWLAHSYEQSRSSAPIRPRAHYIGNHPM